MPSLSRSALLALTSALALSPLVGAQDSASQPEVAAYLKELARRSARVTTLRVRFRQEKKLRILRRPRVSEADLVFAKGRLAITTTDRDGRVESLLLVRDGEMRLYYPELARMEIYPAARDPSQGGGVGASRGASLPLFTGDWRSLQKNHTIALTRQTRAGPQGRPREEVVLRLTPKHAKSRDAEPPKHKTPKGAKDRGATSRLQEIRVTLVDYRVVEYVQTETSGDRVRMQILSWEPGAKIDPRAFELDVPPQTRVVRLGKPTPRSRGPSATAPDDERDSAPAPRRSRP